MSLDLDNVLPPAFAGNVPVDYPKLLYAIAAFPQDNAQAAAIRRYITNYVQVALESFGQEEDQRGSPSKGRGIKACETNILIRANVVTGILSSLANTTQALNGVQQSKPFAVVCVGYYIYILTNINCCTLAVINCDQQRMRFRRHKYRLINTLTIHLQLTTQGR